MQCSVQKNVESSQNVTYLFLLPEPLGGDGSCEPHTSPPCQTHSETGAQAWLILRQPCLPYPAQDSFPQRLISSVQTAFFMYS